MASSAVAQDVDESALDALDKTNPVAVEPIREPAGAVELRAAMRRISYNSSDADALADAGNASLALGDANAALNFFTRANAIRPNNGRIVSGLASATVRTENPFEALRLFDDAVRLGISERTIAADRALAFDLLGNFARAQQDYKLARTASISDDLLIRQAVSLSLAGQKSDADAMLVPLLQKNDAAAWRARAFMLAARGDFRESTKVTQGFMDAGSAQRMERYLRLMPDLTAAQQAAAIHLGHFPASQYVGRDSDQLRRVASTIPPVVPSPGESRLIPSGVPLGQKSAKAEPAKTDKKRESTRERQAREKQELKVAVAAIPESAKLPKTDRSRLSTETARTKVDEAQKSRVSSVNTAGLPPPETARPLVSVSLPPRPEAVAQQVATVPRGGTVISTPAPAAALPQQSPVMPSQTISVPTVVAAGMPQTTAATTVALQGPTPSGAPIAASSPPVMATAAEVAPVISAPVVQSASTPAFDLASIVSSIEIPESEQKPSAVPVDLKKIKPAAPKIAAVEPNAKSTKLDPKAAAKAKAEPANPARFWVQIATGEANALGFDYRKWSKKSADLFKGQSGWTSAWGKTSRLLVGPFADQKAAKKWEGDFKKAGGDGFMWKSENGVVVTALKSK
jgi:Flp pilus assembly protein TadD